MSKYINELGYKIENKQDNDPNSEFVYLEILEQSEASYWDKWEKSTKLKDFASLISDIYDQKPFYSLYPAAADAHYYRKSNYCPKTILFGVGNAGKSHATDEVVEINDFINLIKLYTLFAYRYLKRS